jgi:DNA-binding transcriptional ArsR family regulator
MNDDTLRTERLLEFFRVMADEKRLQIVGLLARQSYSVEELVTILNLSPATVSHHLARLIRAGLAAARAGPAPTQDRSAGWISSKAPGMPMALVTSWMMLAGTLAVGQARSQSRSKTRA